MEYIIIGLVALITALLTFFSGFGVGTILTPAFLLFFPPTVAIAMTAVVHFLNNLFKLGLMYKNIDRKVLLQFGIPAIPFAVLGAWVLLKLASDLEPITTITLFNQNLEIEWVKLTIGFIMIFFAISELFPSFKKKTIKKKHLITGGIVSGFFGGLSGNQGAVRTMFLIKSGLEKNAFIATGVAIACIVDVSRLGIYLYEFISGQNNDFVFTSRHLGFIATATLSAFAGAFLGKKLLQKVTIDVVKYIVAAFIFIIGVLLMLGVI